MVYDLVALVGNGLAVRDFTVQGDKPASKTVFPFVAAVVSKAFHQGIEQKAPILFRADFALEIHVAGSLHALPEGIANIAVI